MNTQRKLYSILSGFLLIAVLLLTGACTREETENTIPVFNPDDPIMIYATVDGTSIATRAGENEKIKSRTMLSLIRRYLPERYKVQYVSSMKKDTDMYIPITAKRRS